MSDLLTITSLVKSFNPKEGNVINGIDLGIPKGAVVSLLGESGSGKTTLARLIAGLEVPDSGEITLDGKIVANALRFVPPQHRKVGMVFQDYALFPHMTVSENVGYGIPNPSEKGNRVQEVLALVGLQDLGHRYPHQLSGGQQQRIALARALAPKPKVLLLDEPFSNLDASLKHHLRSELFQIIRKSNVTALFLTHDTQDAMVVSDSIVVLQNGEILQGGTAKDLFENPNNLYIAALFGPVVEFNRNDLSLFNFTGNASTTYAIRQDRFEVNNKKLPHATTVIIKESTYLGNFFLNRAALPNTKIIQFVSTKKMQNTVLLGFEESALMAFER
ncbi:MAG: ABC transporter ATP-binding protein [Bacteroidota bacterium]